MDCVDGDDGVGRRAERGIVLIVNIFGAASL